MRLSIVLRASTSQAQAIESALRTLMRGTRVESGCLACQVWTQQGESDSACREVYYQEQWASEQAMENRVRSESFTKVLEVLEAAADVPHVEFDFVSRHQGLEYVEGVRRDHRGH